MKRLVRVSEGFRGFCLKSLFVADEADWALIEEWCREEKEVRFGEVAGKHSDLTLTFDIGDFKVISEDQAFIARFEEVVGTIHGVSILGRMCDYCRECGEEMDETPDGICDYCKEDRS